MNTLEEVSTHNTRKEKSFSNSSDNADEFVLYARHELILMGASP